MVTKGKLLTARQVESAKPGDRRREIPDGGTGLYLIVQTSGRKAWAVRYRFRGKPKKFTIGKYPLIGLADARDAAGEALKKVDRGIDPSIEKAEAKRGELNLCRNVGAAFIERYCKPRLRTWPAIERTLDLHVWPVIGDRDIEEVTRRDIIEVLDRVTAGGATVRANRVLANMRRLFGWAMERDIIRESPVTGIKPPSSEQARDRVLSDDEMRAFLHACDRLDEPPKAPENPSRRPRSTKLPTRFGALFALLAYTAQRRDEVSAAPWAEFDTDERLWRLPGARTKNGRAHDVPLAPQVVAILDALPSKGEATMLFPSRGADGRTSSGFGRAKDRLDKFMLEELRKAAEAAGADPSKVELTPWRLHDLRRTAASGMARLGVGIHIVERLLNHVSGATTGGIVAVYQRHDFASEKRSAAEVWASHLDRLLRQTNSNVVDFREAR